MEDGEDEQEEEEMEEEEPSGLRKGVDLIAELEGLAKKKKKKKPVGI